MLLVLPVPFRMGEAGLMVEHQAHHGMRRWLDSFTHLSIAAPLIPEPLALQRPEISWLPASDLTTYIDFCPLPWAYRPDLFLKCIPHVASILNNEIDKCHYLQFALGGLWGDWAAIAAILALKKQRTFSVHTDRVEHEVVLKVSRELSRSRRLRAVAESAMMKALHKFIIKRCGLGLFHGMDTYEYYHAWMQQNGKGDKAYCIHNIHDEGLQETSVKPLPPTPPLFKEKKGLRILYTGRIEATKAPMQWLTVLNRLKEKNMAVDAVWAGDGNLRQEFMKKISDYKLEGIVTTPGFIKDRTMIAELYRSADIFLFTHITPESPRCLLEALRFGVPIIGYESAFARDLIAGNGGGFLVPNENTEILAEAVAELISNQKHLSRLKEQAFKDGARFTSKAVFEERSRLIKVYT